jgi:hypothetical protein
VPRSSQQSGSCRLKFIPLNEAARIAKAAEACASAGSVAEGVTVSMEHRTTDYEAGRLQDAASPLNRLSHE